MTDKLPPAALGQYVVRDTEEPGFFVVVGARTKTFTVQVDVLDVLGKRHTKMGTMPPSSRRGLIQ